MVFGHMENMQAGSRDDAFNKLESWVGMAHLRTCPICLMGTMHVDRWSEPQRVWNSPEIAVRARATCDECDFTASLTVTYSENLRCDTQP